MSAQEREWQPGDKAYVEVYLDSDFASGPMNHRWVTVVGTTICTAVPERLLRPVSGGGEVEAATEAAVARAADALADHDDLGDRFCLCGERLEREDDVDAHRARALAAAGLLLVGGVPGRSEAEVDVRSILRDHWIERSNPRTVTAECGFKGTWAEHEAHVAEKLDEAIVAARVAGTTEAGDPFAPPTELSEIWVDSTDTEGSE